jgi:hypothetical protein
MMTALGTPSWPPPPRVRPTLTQGVRWRDVPLTRRTKITWATHRRTPPPTTTTLTPTMI